MGKLLKIILTVIASLLFLIIIAAVVLPFVINPNDFKPMIQTAVKDHTGRELKISGDLELSVFPWIGVSTGKLSLSNAPGFTDKPFAEIDESRLKVKLLPLLSKKVELSRIVLKGLNLNLAKNKKGVSNWNDLMSATQKQAQPDSNVQAPETGNESNSAIAALAVGGISIENARIVWDDRQTGKYTEIKAFNLETDKLEFNKPMAVDLSLIVENKQPQLTESVRFSTDLLINEKMDLIQLNKLKLHSVTDGKVIPGDALKVTLSSDISIDLSQQTLNISDLSISSDELKIEADIKGTRIKEKPTFQGPVRIAEFNLANFLKKMTGKKPDMQDPDALSKVAMNFVLNATDDSAALQDLTLKLDETTVTGEGHVKDFASPAINFKLNVDNIDADRYMPPKKKHTQSSKTVSASPAAVAAAGATLFPVDTLRKLNANGQLTVNKVKVNNLKMQGLIFKLNARNGQIKTQQQVKQLYQGSYSGSTTINVKSRRPVIVLNEKLNHVQVEPLLKDMQGGEARMSGIVDASASLRGHGNSTDAILSSLGGNIRFLFKDGVVKGFNIQKMIDNTKALLKGAALPVDNKNDQTVFSEISGTAKISNGVLQNHDLKALSSRVHVNGEGTVNLATKRLDYRVIAKLIKKATADQPEKVKGVPLIIKVGGTVDKPVYTLDVPAMLQQKYSDKIEQKKEKLMKKLDEKLKKKLGDKLAPAVGDLIKGFF